MYSVIIPVYNAEKTICRCLDSLLKQNDNMAEIIIVNDGSTDRSSEICRTYARNNACIIYIEQENAGVSAARNAGLDVATGKYITFVDSDDYVMDSYFLALNQSDDADFVVFSFQTIKNNGIHKNKFSKELLETNTNFGLVNKVISNRIAGPCNKRFKRSIIEVNQIRFKQELTIGEDFIFGLEYMLNCHTSRIKTDILYCVDETGMQSITRAAKYDYTQFLLIYKYAFKIVSESTWPELEKTALMQQVDFLYCRTAFACTEHMIRAKGNANINVNELIRLFADNCRFNIKTINAVHTFMRICIRYRFVLLFRLIAYLHILVSIRRKP